MTRSNPKQVVILVVAAVGAIGFLGYSVLGLGKKVAARIAQESEGGERANNQALSESGLRGDPFSHPFLEKSNRDAKAKAEAQIPSPPAPQPPAGNQINPRWPTPIPGLDFGPLRPNVSAVGLPQPAENTGTSRKEEQISRIAFRLSAVVNVERTVAFLSVAGKESRAFREGDLLAPGWRLLQIDEAGVDIGNGKRRKHLTLGQEVTL